MNAWHEVYSQSSDRIPQALSYSYITSTSRISLLLHETKDKAQGRVLITMIS